MDNHTPNNLTPVQVQVLNALAQGATITVAARTAGLHRTTIYNWINHQPDFEAAVEDAKAEYAATVQDELRVLSRDALATLRTLLDDPETPRALRFKVAMAILQRPQSPDRDWRLPEIVEEPREPELDVRAELQKVEFEGAALAEYLRRKRMSNPSNVSNSVDTAECVESVEPVESVECVESVESRGYRRAPGARNGSGVQFPRSMLNVAREHTPSTARRSREPRP